MSALSANWDEVRKLLREARDSLAPGGSNQIPSPVPVGPLTGTLDEFEEFLEHNELELAWDTLAAVADRASAPAAFWRRLARAAGLMGLLDKEDQAWQHATPSVPSDRALAVARLDAEKAYRNLLAFRISITLEPDGWHVDYDLRDPMGAGGGPHYVIDPVSGEMLSKRYEQ
jgi:hypothetical protein